MKNRLCLQISHDGKFGRIINDRVLKEETTVFYKRLRQLLMYMWSYHCLHLINKLWPILLYRNAVWSLPNHQNLIYLTKQNEDQRPREIASEFTYSALRRNVPITYARLVGKTSDAENRCVLIRLKHYNDVLGFIQSPNNGTIVEFQHLPDIKDPATELVHKKIPEEISKHQ